MILDSAIWSLAASGFTKKNNNEQINFLKVIFELYFPLTLSHIPEDLKHCLKQFNPMKKVMILGT